MRCALRRTWRKSAHADSVKSIRREEIAPPARIPLKDRRLAAVMTGGMTMKTRNTFIAAAIVAVLSCSAAHAQVLGGAVGGAASGVVGRGNSAVFGSGNA